MRTTLQRLAHELADRYRVEHEVGAGGMATVYLAEDLKHRRRVAIKVLREEVAATVGHARFLREVEIAAGLQHPNILPVLDSGDAAGALYYVMPFVDGRSLRERLDADGPLPIGDAVRVLCEVVDALGYAHARGVIHRDVKPDNVMLSGRHALITDFGVARALSVSTDGGSATATGIALGTPAYMAPEQIAADPAIDHRADLYAVGVLAYELVAGQTPFAGRAPHELLVAHLTAVPPPMATHRADVPPAFERIVLRCLEKRPEDRWQRAEELLGALESLGLRATSSVETVAPAPLTRHAAGATVRRRAAIGAGGLVLAALVAWGVFRLARPAGRAPFVVGDVTRLTADDGLEVQPDLSPDGRLVAYAAGTSVRLRIFVRPIAGGRTIALSDDTSAVETQPRWSPDGSRLLFLSHGGVRVAPAAGGESRALVAEAPNAPVRAATWAPDGRALAFVRSDTLFVRAVGGPGMADAPGAVPRVVGTAFELHSCAWSPVGARIACVSGNALYGAVGSTFGNLAPSAILLFPAAGGAPDTVATRDALHQSPVWSTDARTLYFVSDRQGPRDVYSLGIAPDGRPTGTPVRVTTGLGVHSISLAADGARLAYAVYRDEANVWSLPLAAPGAAPRRVTSGTQVIEAMRVSRDGQWLTYDSNLQGHAEIYRLRLPAGAPERLTNGRDENFRADLSPDGSEIAFQSWRTGTRDLYVQPLDGGPARPVTNTPAQEAAPVWSPDGRMLALVDLDGARGLFVVRRAGVGRWGRPAWRGTSDPGGADWSPDGTTLAFILNGTVRVVPADSGPERVVYAPAAGTDDPAAEQVQWLRVGTTLLFKSHDAAGRASFWSVPSSGGRPRLLARLDDLAHTSNRPDFSTDGTRLYFAIQDRQSDIWVAEVARR